MKNLNYTAMRPSYYEGVAARMMGLSNEHNPYRHYITTQVMAGRDPERSFPAIFEYASDYDSGYTAAGPLQPFKMEAAGMINKGKIIWIKD